MNTLIQFSNNNRCKLEDSFNLLWLIHWLCNYKTNLSNLNSNKLSKIKCKIKLIKAKTNQVQNQSKISKEAQTLQLLNFSNFNLSLGNLTLNSK